MKHILIVPSPVYQQALLDGGPAGARVPKRRWNHVGGGLHEWVEATRNDNDAQLDHLSRTALVIVQAGVPAREGRDRLAETLARREGLTCGLGALWRPTTGSLGGYVLDTGDGARGAIEYTANPPHLGRGRIRSRNQHVPALALLPHWLEPSLLGLFEACWALSVVAEARGLGEVVVLE